MILFLTIATLVLLIVIGVDIQQKRREYLRTGKIL